MNVILVSGREFGKRQIGFSLFVKYRIMEEY
jgi:hypothetical protein